MPIKIIIESPCKHSLTVASGDPNDFHCATCNKTVMDMRGRKKKESVALLRSVESPCAIFRTNSAGEIVFESEKSGRNIISQSLLLLAFVISGRPISDAVADEVEGLTEQRDDGAPRVCVTEDSPVRVIDLGVNGGPEPLEVQSEVYPGACNPAGAKFIRAYIAKATYGDVRISEPWEVFADNMITFLRGASGACVMILSGLGGMSSLLIGYTRRSKSILCLALILGFIAVVMLMARVGISSYFNDVTFQP